MGLQLSKSYCLCKTSVLGADLVVCLSTVSSKVPVHAAKAHQLQSREAYNLVQLQCSRNYGQVDMQVSTHAGV